MPDLSWSFFSVRVQCWRTSRDLLVPLSLWSSYSDLSTYNRLLNGVQVQYCDGLRGALIIYDPQDPYRFLYDIDDGQSARQSEISVLTPKRRVYGHHADGLVSQSQCFSRMVDSAPLSGTTYHLLKSRDRWFQTRCLSTVSEVIQECKIRLTPSSTFSHTSDIDSAY